MPRRCVWIMGLRDPSPSVPYKLVPADEHLDRPAVVELLKAFGHGDLDHQAAQAAAWHLNNDMSWDELAAQQDRHEAEPQSEPVLYGRATEDGDGL